MSIPSLLSEHKSIMVAMLHVSRQIADHLQVEPQACLAELCRQQGVNRTYVYRQAERLGGALAALAAAGPGRPPAPPQERPEAELAALQLTVAVQGYQLEHPGALVRHQGRTSYSPPFRRFVLGLYDGWAESLETFAQAAQVPLDTLRQWIQQDRQGPPPTPEVKPPVLVPRDSSALVHQIACAWQSWQGSRRDFVHHAARTFGLRIAQVVHLLRLLGILASRAPKTFRHRGTTQPLSPGALLVTDGKEVAVLLTASGQRLTFNWQAMVDQATGCDTAAVISSQECAAAVGEAYQQSLSFAGGQAPTGLLHDNKPCYQDSQLQAQLHQQGTLMIPATEARGENKAIIEGAFSLFEQRVGTIRLDDRNRQTLAQSAVQEVIRAYTAATNAVPRVELEGQSRQAVFRQACPSSEQQEQDRQFLQNLQARHRQQKARRPRQDPLSRALLETVFARLGLLGHDPKGSLRDYLATFEPAAIRRAAAIVTARKERGLLDQEHLHRYLTKVIQNIQQEIDLERAARELADLCQAQQETWTAQLEQDFQRIDSQLPSPEDQVRAVAELAAHGGLPLEQTFWADRLQQLLHHQQQLITTAVTHLVRLFEAPADRRLALIDRITALQFGVA